MRTITKTEVFIRLLFLFCVISGAMVSSFFTPEKVEITKANQQETITVHNTFRN